MILMQVPRQIVQIGQQSLGPSAIPLGLVKIQMTINRFAWPDLGLGINVLQAGFDISLDDGVTFPFGVGFSTGGGVIMLHGVEQPTRVGIDLPGDPQSALRKIRANVNVLAALDLSAVIEGF